MTNPLETISTRPSSPKDCPHKGLELISILILQRLEDRVCRIAVELDIELRPNIIGQLVQLTPCRNGHQNCSRTFLDREFSQPGGLG
jgi:hypothetical protein